MNKRDWVVYDNQADDIINLNNVNRITRIHTTDTDKYFIQFFMEDCSIKWEFYTKTSCDIAYGELLYLLNPNRISKID